MEGIRFKSLSLVLAKTLCMTVDSVQGYKPKSLNTIGIPLLFKSCSIGNNTIGLSKMESGL